ncbi:hypothetical protein NE237_003343 [Protea cynaroides]|uniref:Uncharacterized protein n=1 Tax=Protea cynaroides TaxID=273540 RepID=A0A9Q0QSM4_9MAGN|nr:hypothetical protein NE237_003343 [Protea cynaroides]
MGTFLFLLLSFETYALMVTKPFHSSSYASPASVGCFPCISWYQIAIVSTWFGDWISSMADQRITEIEPTVDGFLGVHENSADLIGRFLMDEVIMNSRMSYSCVGETDIGSNFKISAEWVFSSRPKIGALVWNIFLIRKFLFMEGMQQRSSVVLMADHGQRSWIQLLGEKYLTGSAFLRIFYPSIRNFSLLGHSIISVMCLLSSA